MTQVTIVVGTHQNGIIIHKYILVLFPRIIGIISEAHILGRNKKTHIKFDLAK